MAPPRKHPPVNALADIEMLACKGYSTIGLAKHFGVSRSLIVRWFEDYPSFEEAYEQGRDSYRQYLEEQIISMTLANRSAAGFMYLLKAKFKMYDQPNKNDTINVGVQVEAKPVMVVQDFGSDDDWAAKAAEQQRNLTLIASNQPSTPALALAGPSIPAALPESVSVPPSVSVTPARQREAPTWEPNS